MSKLKEITFTFENCDCVTIDGKYICDFAVSGIRKTIKRIACNAINEYDYCKNFFIEISKGAKDIGTMTGETFFTRRFDDITSINFTLEDDIYDDIYDENTDKYIGITTKDYDYAVDWKDISSTNASICENANQKTYLSDCGNLYILISKKKTMEDYVDMTEINDVESMELKFNCCDVEY